MKSKTKCNHYWDIIDKSFDFNIRRTTYEFFCHYCLEIMIVSNVDFRKMGKGC